jgi:hypothetical protein
MTDESGGKPIYWKNHNIFIVERTAFVKKKPIRLEKKKFAMLKQNVSGLRKTSLLENF